jgi:hypothetical protein
LGHDGVAFEWRRRIFGILEILLKRDISIEDDSVEIAAVVAGTTGAGTVQTKESLANALTILLPASTPKIKIVSDV